MADFPAVIALSRLDGGNGFRSVGEAGGDFSGRSVSSAGDVNGARSYDADGSGGVDAVQFATLANRATLTLQNIAIV